jgi:type VI protein secretion system component VasK
VRREAARARQAARRRRRLGIAAALAVALVAGIGGVAVFTASSHRQTAASAVPNRSPSRTNSANTVALEMSASNMSPCTNAALSPTPSAAALRFESSTMSGLYSMPSAIRMET